MIHINHVTLLESFRRFQVGTSETYDTEESLIDNLTVTFKGNDLTNIGSAGHYLVEIGEQGNFVSDEVIFSKFGVKMTTEQKQLFFDHAQQMKPFVPEVWHKKVFNTSRGEVLVSGTCDVLQGTIIRDTKCKFRSPSMMDYFDSYQWRFYLSMFGLDRFMYDVFEFTGNNFRDVTLFELKQHEPFECLRYPKMETDLVKLIDEFLDWVEFRNLGCYLKTKP